MTITCGRQYHECLLTFKKEIIVNDTKSKGVVGQLLVGASLPAKLVIVTKMNNSGQKAQKFDVRCVNTGKSAEQVVSSQIQAFLAGSDWSEV